MVSGCSPRYPLGSPHGHLCGHGIVLMASVLLFSQNQGRGWREDNGREGQQRGPVGGAGGDRPQRHADDGRPGLRGPPPRHPEQVRGPGSAAGRCVPGAPRAPLPLRVSLDGCAFVLDPQGALGPRGDGGLHLSQGSSRATFQVLSVLSPVPVCSAELENEMGKQRNYFRGEGGHGAGAGWPRSWV